MFFILRHLFAFVVSSSILLGCAASGPAYTESGVTSVSLPDQMARLVFFRTRDSSLYFARKAAVYVGGEKVGATAYGGFHYVDVPAGSHRLRADMWDAPGECELTLFASGGQTYYFQVDPRSESFGAFAVTGFAADLASGGIISGLASGLAGSAVESYGKECGGAFKLYPVDPDTARLKLQVLNLST